jgi:cytochrome P450
MQDFTFSNGITIPKGNTIQAIGNPLHQDPEFYPDPLEFKPFRFYDLMKKEEKGSKKFELVTPSEEYLAWGRGKHAWCVLLHSPISPFDFQPLQTVPAGGSQQW